jgi:polar amino acid transport system substrate-binding protein
MRALRFSRLLLCAAAVTSAGAQDVKAMRDALAPTGTLRAAFLGGNPVQGSVDPKTGEARGPVGDIVRELARRLGVPFKIAGLEGVPAVMNAVRTGGADVGFLAYDATRAEQVAFTQAYSLGHNTYMVRRDSPLQTFAEFDRPGVRIGLGAGDAVDLHLSRTLKQAQIVRPTNRSMEEAVRLLNAREIDAFAANKQRLSETVAKAPNLRLLEGSVLPVQQSMVAAKENVAAVKILDSLIDEWRNSGLLKEILARANLAGVEVAPRTSR